MKVIAPRALLLGWFPVLLLLAGCASQQEGERCDRLNNQLDCDTGLQCVSITGQGLPYQLCCPISGPITVAACNGATGSTDAGSTTDVVIRRDASDASTADSLDSGTDATSDTVTQDRTTVDVREEPTVDVRTDRLSTDATPEGSTDDASEAGPSVDVSVDHSTTDVSIDTSLDVSSDPTDDVPAETGADSILIDAAQPDVIPDAPNADSAG